MSNVELEKLAASNSEMPADLNAAEQLFYLSLRNLYLTYNAGKISKDIAKIEKTGIYKQYEINILNLACYEQMATRFKKLAVLHNQLKNSGCELCRKYVDTLNGID